MKRNKIVLIEWDDTGVKHGWLELGNDNCIAHCHSVGFYISEDELGVTISFAVSDQGLVMEKKTIAKGCIRSMKELRVR